MWAFLSVAFAADVPWQRPINDAFEHDAHVWIGPFSERLDALARKFGGTVRSGADPLPEEGVPYVYGDPSSNGVLGDVLAWHGITLDADGVTFGGTRVAAADPFLIVALPRPGRLAEPVVVYTAWSVEAQPQLNRVFHGPTGVVIGHVVDGEPKTLYAGGFDLNPDGRVRGLSIGSARLMAAEAVEDLHALRDQLLSGYAGLPDVDAVLRASGSSWDARLAATEQTFATRERQRTPDDHTSGVVLGRPAHR